MATRESRIAEFNTGVPLGSEHVELLCEDHNGTYKLPFEGKFENGEWLNANSSKVLEVTVVGWRAKRR